MIHDVSGSRSGASPPRSSPSLAIARSVGSSGSDVNKLPSQPSSPKAVSALVLTSSHKGWLFCVRGLRPLTHADSRCMLPMWVPDAGSRCGLPMWAPDVGSRRLWFRSSAEERWFGSVNDGRGHPHHFAISDAPVPSALVSFVS